MSERTITVQHDGTTYYGFLAKIRSTSLGAEDHGIFTAYLMTEWPSGGVGVGGFSLDTYNKDTKAREGTAYGLDHIAKLMETVGVHRWEDLPGKHVIVLFKERNSLGSTAAGIAAADSDKVMILKDHAESWRERLAVTA